MTDVSSCHSVDCNNNKKIVFLNQRRVCNFLYCVVVASGCACASPVATSTTIAPTNERTPPNPITDATTIPLVLSNPSLAHEHSLGLSDQYPLMKHIFVLDQLTPRGHGWPPGLCL